MLKTTQSGHLLLESLEEEKPAVPRPVRAFLGRKQVISILETIASTQNPYYLAKTLPGVKAEGLVGKTVEVHAPRIVREIFP